MESEKKPEGTLVGRATERCHDRSWRFIVTQIEWDGIRDGMAKSP